MCQWSYSVKGDITIQMKADLSDFQIREDLSFLTSMSRRKFKEYVNRKASEYTLSYLKSLQSKHTKLKDLSYDCLSLQTYITQPGLTLLQRRNVFLARTRMLNFGENYRNGRSNVYCSLGCADKLDSQIHCFTECIFIKNEISINFKYEYIFRKNVPQKTCTDLSEVLKVRNNLIDEKYITYSPSQD